MRPSPGAIFSRGITALSAPQRGLSPPFGAEWSSCRTAPERLTAAPGRHDGPRSKSAAGRFTIRALDALLAQALDPFTPLQSIHPFLWDGLIAIIKPCKTTGNSTHGISVISEVHRFQQGVFEAVGIQQGPDCCFQRVDNIAVLRI